MDDVLTYRVPFSAEAEQAVLGAMLIDARCVADVIGAVRTDEFYSQTNSDIFGTIYQMFSNSQAIDPVTVLDQMKARGVWQESSPGYVLELMSITPTAANVLEYAAIVRDKAMLREAQAAAIEAARAVSENRTLGEVQSVFQNALDAAGDCRDVRSVSLSDASVALYQELDARQKAGGSVAGIKTGYGELDAMLGGLRSGTMIVIAARSGMGKSAFALNLATETAKLNKRSVLIFSLEMNAVELCERVYANYARLDLHKIRDASLSMDEWRRIAGTAATVSQYTVRIVDAPTLDIGKISEICRREKPALVIIDHIGLVQPTGHYSNRREAVDAISRSIKNLAKSLSIPVIAVAQLNRALMGRTNKEPILSDLRESGAIEQDADVVILLHRPHYFSAEANKLKASISVAKNRSGRTGNIPLLWYGSHQRFVEDWTAAADAAEEDCITQQELPL